MEVQASFLQLFVCAIALRIPQILAYDVNDAGKITGKAIGEIHSFPSHGDGHPVGGNGVSVHSSSRVVHEPYLRHSPSLRYGTGYEGRGHEEYLTQPFNGQFTQDHNGDERDSSDYPYVISEGDEYNATPYDQGVGHHKRHRHSNRAHHPTLGYYGGYESHSVNPHRGDQQFHEAPQYYHANPLGYRQEGLSSYRGYDNY